MSDDNDDG